MPLVMVRRKPAIFDADLKRVLDVLPATVAIALSCGLTGSDTQLTEKEIEVWVSEASQFDRGTRDLEIMVFAHDHPERRADLDYRRRLISNKVMEALLKCKNVVDGWVWVYLGHSDFGYFWN